MNLLLAFLTLSALLYANPVDTFPIPPWTRHISVSRTGFSINSARAQVETAVTAQLGDYKKLCEANNGISHSQYVQGTCIPAGTSPTQAWNCNGKGTAECAVAE